MRILIIGAGKMGTFFSDLLCFKHTVGIFDTDAHKLRFTFNTERMTELEQIREFDPELVINAATVKYTLDAFCMVMPYLSDTCILADIASVKNGLPEFYATCGHPFVSTHPMFGPTFASLSNLSNENAIIISEGDHLGKVFFKDLYNVLHLNIREYTFKEHDEVIAFSLSIPFTSTLVVGSVMKHQDAPGTTFKRHMAIARGLMSEDDFLLTEILFNPHSVGQIEKIQDKLETLKQIIKEKDSAEMKNFLEEVRQNIR